MRQRLITIAIFLVCLFAVQAWQSRLSPTGAAPAFELPELMSNALAPLPAKDSRVELIYFFAPWCGVCRHSTANAETIARWFPWIKVRFVGLDYDNKTEVETFVRETKLVSPVLLGNERVNQAWRIQAYPTYALLSEQGVILTTSVGYSTTLGMAVRALFARAFQ